MATNDETGAASLLLSAEEKARKEREERKRIEDLANQISKRWEPESLGHATVAEAGRVEKLDDATRHSMERRLGARFHDVRVVRGAFADRITKHHRADALTVGRTGLILVRDTPRANFRTPHGQALLAHELTHVRQAQQGMHFALETGGQTSALEAEAHRQEALTGTQQDMAAIVAKQFLEHRVQRLFEGAVAGIAKQLAEDAHADNERGGSHNERG